MPHRSQHAQFALAALTRTDPPQSLRLAGDPNMIASRFGVYRNNIFASLVAALRARFPGVLNLVGDEFFRGVAAEFVAEHPPSSPVVLDYGALFPGFVRTFPAAKVVPYLGDVAALEWAVHEAFHAPDDVPAVIAQLSEFGASDAAALRFVLHPAVRIVASPYPILSIWRIATGQIGATSVELSGSECVLVTRPEIDVQTHMLSQEEEAFLRAIRAGSTLGAAAQAGFASESSVDLAYVLASIFAAGAVLSIAQP